MLLSSIKNKRIDIPPKIHFYKKPKTTRGETTEEREKEKAKRKGSNSKEAFRFRRKSPIFVQKG